MILNVCLALLNAIVAWNVFNSNQTQRLDRLEDRTEILWKDWVDERRAERRVREQDREP